jgi:hypothetical protein
MVDSLDCLASPLAAHHAIGLSVLVAYQPRHHVFNCRRTSAQHHVFGHSGQFGFPSLVEVHGDPIGVE